MKAKVIDLRILALLAAMLLPTMATAGTADAAFLPLYTFVNNMVGGYVGRTISIAAVIIGALLSVAKGNPIPVLAGIGFAVFLSYGPSVINGILTATI